MARLEQAGPPAGLQVVPFELPEGSVAGYYPECNPLLPLWHRAR
jgi:hypothetical protein